MEGSDTGESVGKMTIQEAIQRLEIGYIRMEASVTVLIQIVDALESSYDCQELLESEAMKAVYSILNMTSNREEYFKEAYSVCLGILMKCAFWKPDCLMEDLISRGFNMKWMLYILKNSKDDEWDVARCLFVLTKYLHKNKSDNMELFDFLWEYGPSANCLETKKMILIALKDFFGFSDRCIKNYITQKDLVSRILSIYFRKDIKDIAVEAAQLLCMVILPNISTMLPKCEEFVELLLKTLNETNIGDDASIQDLMLVVADCTPYAFVQWGLVGHIHAYIRMCGVRKADAKMLKLFYFICHDGHGRNKMREISNWHHIFIDIMMHSDNITHLYYVLQIFMKFHRDAEHLNIFISNGFVQALVKYLYLAYNRTAYLLPLDPFQSELYLPSFPTANRPPMIKDNAKEEQKRMPDVPIKNVVGHGKVHIVPLEFHESVTRAMKLNSVNDNNCIQMMDACFEHAKIIFHYFKMDKSTYVKEYSSAEVCLRIVTLLYKMISYKLFTEYACDRKVWLPLMFALCASPDPSVEPSNASYYSIKNMKAVIHKIFFLLCSDRAIFEQLALEGFAIAVYFTNNSLRIACENTLEASCQEFFTNARTFYGNGNVQRLLKLSKGNQLKTLQWSIAFMMNSTTKEVIYEYLYTHGLEHFYKTCLDDHTSSDYKKVIICLSVIADGVSWKCMESLYNGYPKIQLASVNEKEVQMCGEVDRNGAGNFMEFLADCTDDVDCEISLKEDEIDELLASVPLPVAEEMEWKGEERKGGKNEWKWREGEGTKEGKDERCDEAKLEDKKKIEVVKNVVIALDDGHCLLSHENRMILASYSKFFETLLKGDFIESKQKVVKLPEISKECFEVILNLVICNEKGTRYDKPFNLINVLNAVIHVHRFNMFNIFDCLINALIQPDMFTEENIPLIFSWAHMYGELIPALKIFENNMFRLALSNDISCKKRVDFVKGIIGVLKESAANGNEEDPFILFSILREMLDKIMVNTRRSMESARWKSA